MYMCVYVYICTYITMPLGLLAVLLVVELRVPPAAYHS